MIILRIMGYILIILGILLSLTIIGATFGIPMILVGLLFVYVGKNRTPLVVQVQQVQNVEHLGHQSKD